MHADAKKTIGRTPRLLSFLWQGREGRARSAREKCVGALHLALLLTLLPVLVGARQARGPVALQGKLASVAGVGPTLQTQKRDYSLAGKTSTLLHTLQDARLVGHEVRLEGALRPDGVFEVEKLFTVRSGKLYRVRYYCEVCNIEALEPGNCVCCQQPTELQEIPANAPAENSPAAGHTPRS